MTSWHGKQVVVVGMGETGSAAARLLLKYGAAVLASDSASDTVCGETAARLRALGAECETGGHTTERFLNADTIVMSPGVPPSIPPVAKAAASGVPVVSELELAFGFAKAPIVAVTGTNGKTTVCTLIHDIFETAGVASVYTGNTDTPFSESVMDDRPPDVYVIEVSSFQLERTTSFRPEVGVLLNITPDHLDRYDGFGEYVAAKQRMFTFQKPADFAVLNARDPLAMAVGDQTRGQSVLISRDAEVETGCWTDHGNIRYRLPVGQGVLCSETVLQVPGTHNVENVMAACSAAMLMGAEPRFCADTVRRFTGLEHRIEFVGEYAGVSYINDSKSTNIDSTRRAIEAVEGPVVLIAGGLGKGESYGSLQDLIKNRARAIVLIGEEAEAMADAFAGCAATQLVESMDEAVREAARLAKPGDVVLLSPACASFDMFDSFKHRGRAFKDAVRKMEDICAEKHT